MSVTVERIKQLFIYADGKLIRKQSTSHNAKEGSSVGWKTGKQGHLCVEVDGKRYFVHQLVFMLHHNYIPKEIDHIDNNPLNNRIENLRACNRSQNCYNRTKPKSNTSGVKNVHWRKDRNKWIVTFRNVEGKALYFGSFSNLEDAEKVAKNLEINYFVVLLKSRSYDD